MLTKDCFPPYRVTPTDLFSSFYTDNNTSVVPPRSRRQALQTATEPLLLAEKSAMPATETDPSVVTIHRDVFLSKLGTARNAPLACFDSARFLDT